MIINLYKKFLFKSLLCVLVIFMASNVNVSIGQVNHASFSLPCYSAQETPNYLKAFMECVCKQENEHVTVKQDKAEGLGPVIIQFNSLNLERISYIFDKQKDLSGFLSGYLSLSGTCKYPVIRGSITLKKGSVLLSNFGRG